MELEDILDLVSAITLEFKSGNFSYEVSVGDWFVMGEDADEIFDNGCWDKVDEDNNCGGIDVRVDNKYLSNSFIYSGL